MTTRSRNVGYTSKRQLARARKEAFYLLRPSPSSFLGRAKLLRGNQVSRSYLDRIYSQGIPGHLNRWRHPENHLNAIEGGLLDLAVSSVTGELLGFRIFQLDFIMIFLHKRCLPFFCLIFLSNFIMHTSFSVIFLYKDYCFKTVKIKPLVLQHY